MPVFSPQLLAEWTTGRWLGTPPNSEIRGFCHDTRQLKTGDCFVAIKTEQRDGHDYLEDARAAGASAALVSSPRQDVELPQLLTDDALIALQTIALQHRHTFPRTVIGVTGSCGKTSTKDLIALLLGEGCLKTEKNLNNTLGVPLTLTQLDPVKHTTAVIEAGINQPGEMSVLGGIIAPNVAVVTMIGPAHLEKLGSMDNIAQEKAELARFAAPGSSLICGSDCLAYPVFCRFSGETFAVTNTCEHTPTLENTEYRSCFRVFRENGGARIQVHSALFTGQFYINANLTAGMASNAVIAVLTAILCGAKWADIQERLKEWKPGADRGSIYRMDNNFYYVDCYNANPASMRDALDTFITLAPKDMPRLYTLGGMRELGEHSETLHRKIGEGLKLRSRDRAVLIGEEAEAYAAGMRVAGANERQLTVVSDTSAAQEVFSAFTGAHFIKGSRAYALESLLPVGLINEKEAAAC